MRKLLILACLVCSVAPAWAQEELTVTKIYTPSATDLTMLPTGDLVLTPTGKDVLPGTGYDVNLGMLTRKYLTLHAAELWVETLVAQNTIATIGGRVLVGPTTILTSDIGTGATSILVKHNSLASGDRVYLEANGSVEFMAITSSASGSGPYTYSVTRNLDGSGANAWTAGDAVFNTGTTGDGFIDLYSVRGVKAGTELGPTIVGNVRLSSTYNDWAPRWAIGNLNGLYSYSSDIYGAAFGVPGGARLTIDPTNGIQMYDGSNNARVLITPAGAASFSGDGDNVTNIDGGNIQTQTITATQIAARSIDVGHLNATGYQDNVIKNGVFEGASSTVALAGWSKDSNSTSATAIQNSCCGQNGPGTLLLDSGNSFYLSASYQAFPVLPGSTYRVSAKIHAASTSAAAFHALIYENNTSTAGVQRILFSGAGAGQVNQTSLTFLCNSCAVTSGWQTVEYTYTVPSGIYWAALVFYNVSGSFSSSTYTALNFDDVEMQKQIGAGHIIANSITANEIAANAITTSELNADSVTSAKIAAGTIVAADIAAATITGTQIAASTITASNLSVSTLSAITGNMGTLTAGSITGGTIDGATIRAGSGDEVTLDSSGITMAAGTGANNKIKWSDGVTVSAPNSGSVLYVDGNLTVERQINVTGTGAGAAAITVSGGFGIAADTLISPSMASSTGTTVIWENACGCLKKQTSSARYKENVQPWGGSALRLLDATPIAFNYRGGSSRVLGLSAEELYGLAPEAVNLDAEGRPDSIDQSGLNAYLVQVIKELRAEVVALKSERGQR